MGTTTARMIGQNIATVFQLHREKLKTGACPRVTTAQVFLEFSYEAYIDVQNSDDTVEMGTIVVTRIPACGDITATLSDGSTPIVE